MTTDSRTHHRKPRRDSRIVIYAVTMVTDVSHTRCVGVFGKYAEARKVVERNELDISDGGTYQYAVISPVPLGDVYPLCRSEDWFVYDTKLETYTSLSTVPPQFENIVGWGIG